MTRPSSRHLRAALLLAIGFAIGAITVGGAVAARYITGGDTEVTSIKLTGGGLPDLGGTIDLRGRRAPEHDPHLPRLRRLRAGDRAPSTRRRSRRSSNQLRRLREVAGTGQVLGVQPQGPQVPSGEAGDRARHRRDLALQLRGPQRHELQPGGPGLRRGRRQRPGDRADARALPLRPRARASRRSSSPGARMPCEPADRVEPAGGRLRPGLLADDQARRSATRRSSTRAASGRGSRRSSGFTILVNVGDQDSDLAGGHARRAFKLPNPMYFIP